MRRLLDPLADALLTTLSDGGQGFLVHLVADPEVADGGRPAFNLGVLPLDGQAPAAMLLGTVAPPEWSAVGVAASGRAWHLDRPGEAAGRADSVVLVGRDRSVVGRLRHHGVVSAEPPAAGLTYDCLHRALGLPTPPPEVPPSQLLDAVWLSAVVAAGRHGPLPWRVIRSLHPAADGLEGIEGADGWTGPDGWTGLRSAVVAGAWPSLGLWPEEAAWFDDGSFSRWVLSRYRPVPSLLSDVRRLLGAAQADRCARFLRANGPHRSSQAG